MRENSQKWHTATTKAEKQQYVAANERLAQQLSAEIGRKVVKGYDGNWYLDKVGGQMLFDVYPGTTNADKINPLIDQMKENSRLWYSVDTKEERQQYIDANEQIAK